MNLLNRNITRKELLIYCNNRNAKYNSKRTRFSKSWLIQNSKSNNKAKLIDIETNNMLIC